MQRIKNNKIIGLCAGMQILGKSSEEYVKCLSLIDSNNRKIKKFKDLSNPKYWFSKKS